MGENEEISLFVPGRLCLFGEHSDWAGGHRRQNSEIEKGYTIIAPTNQGTYAKARKLDEKKLAVKSTLDDKVFEIDMEKKKLLRESRKESLFSHIAGTAYQILVHYNNIHGLEINNYKTDLPIKKGLSSSASICVLTARAFNNLYGIGLTKEGEMDLAYRGETTTPSRCGRMDQACAFNEPILISYDADLIEIKPLEVGEDIHMLIVDLRKEKNTRKILAELNKGFPFPTSDLEKKKHEYLGKINKDIVFKAVEYIKEGNAEKLGKLMNKAQEKFDAYLAPACPEELIAPKLHSVLYYSRLRPHIYGGKGVGSQGDGTAQLICKSKEDKEKAKEILESELDVECLDLDLKRT